MPKKVELADGTEIEIPTEEEVKASEESAKELEGLKKVNEAFGLLKTELGLGEDEDPIEKLKELKDSQNPNWPKMRAQMKAANEKLKESGFEMDDEGKITKAGEKVDVDDIVEKAKEAGKQGVEIALAKQMKEKMFGQFTDEEEKKSVETLFDKLVESGVDPNQSFELAVGQVLPDRKNDIVSEAFNSGSGNGPKPAGEKKEPLSDAAKGLEESLGLNEKKDEGDANKPKE